MSFENNAAWLTAIGAPLEVKSSEIFEPESDELLIKNKAWAINPIDWKMQQWGTLVPSFPATIGSDIAGEVVAVGSAVTAFKVGDIVAGLPLGFANGRWEGNGFQTYTTISTRAAFQVPANLTAEEAVKLPLGIATAAAGLYQKQNLGLPFPQRKSQPSGKTVIIWGATSNVGSAAVQLAAASGLDVVATASAGNEAAIKSLGAAAVFDHRSNTVVDDLITYLKDKDITGAFDSISSPETTSALSKVLSHFGGGVLAITQPQKPESSAVNVDMRHVQALQIFTTSPEVGEAVFEKYVPKALAEGQLRAYQKSHIAGHGLESIQPALDELRKGPSGTKVIVLA